MQVNVIAAQPHAAEPEVRVFDSPAAPADRDALDRLAGQVRGADLAAPPVALPDFHHEGGMESPCSIAVATRETIRPNLVNASVNCGMALIALDGGRPDARSIAAFYRRIRERLPHPGGYRPRVSAKDVLRASVQGSGFAVERWGVDPAELARVEESGLLPVEPHGGPDRVRKELPWLVRQLSRLEFGTVGPTNHFIELQQVEEVIDPTAAGLLGVAQGQLTIQYHAGGGVLTGIIGRMYGRRTDYPLKHRAFMAMQKPLLHLARSRSVEELRRRLALYFSEGCPPVPRSGTEGQRLLLANAAAMNYGFAYRLAVYAELRAAAAATLGAAGSSLVVDSPHDTLYEEEHGGERVLVHRYKSSRAFPASKMPDHPVFGRTGQAVLLPGTNRTSSFLCVADEGARDSVYSACHGTGTIVSHFADRGLSGPDPLGRTTLRFGYSGGAPAEVPQLDDRGVGEALGILRTHGIVRPVARLRPLAVLT
ncbi:MAG: RtcB family protein [Actinomycetota bacterium]|nr:RtcB family protein [Actinomycetota bacterium]